MMLAFYEVSITDFKVWISPFITLTIVKKYCLQSGSVTEKDVFRQFCFYAMSWQVDL